MQAAVGRYCASLCTDVVSNLRPGRFLSTLSASNGLQWAKPPACILVIKKPGVAEPSQAFREIAPWLINNWGANRVLAEPAVLKAEPDLAALGVEAFQDASRLSDEVDAVVCLGGDGTILYASTLFGPSRVPPVVAFALGTVGFLTPFRVDEFESVLTAFLEGGIPVHHRPRLDVRLAASSPSHCSASAGVPLVAVNEVVVARPGPNHPTAPVLQCHVDGRLAYTGAGDGIILSSATGSTAYSLSAGGPVVAPTVDATILTSLSPTSRTIASVLPVSSTVTVDILPFNTQPRIPIASQTSSAAVHSCHSSRLATSIDGNYGGWLPGAHHDDITGSSSDKEGVTGTSDDRLDDEAVTVDVDGKPGMLLRAGDSLIVRQAKHPLITATAGPPLDDWLSDITSVLNWNLQPSRRPAHTTPAKSVVNKQQVGNRA